jgi:hypothetical protein
MTRGSKTACCAVRRGRVAAATLCLFPIASTSLTIGTILSGFVVLWGLSLRGEADFFPSLFYLFTPPLYTVAGQLVSWTLDRTADFPKSRRFTFGQRVDNLSLDCIQQGCSARFTPPVTNGKSTRPDVEVWWMTRERQIATLREEPHVRSVRSRKLPIL